MMTELLSRKAELQINSHGGQTEINLWLFIPQNVWIDSCSLIDFDSFLHVFAIMREKKQFLKVTISISRLRRAQVS